MNLRLLEAAERPHTPAWQLGIMTICVADPVIGTALAQNLNTPKWAASWLSSHASPTVREALAGRCGLGNRFLSLKARQKLLGDSEPRVRDRAELAYSNQWPPKWMSEGQSDISVFG